VGRGKLGQLLRACAAVLDLPLTQHTVAVLPYLRYGSVRMHTAMARSCKAGDSSKFKTAASASHSPLARPQTQPQLTGQALAEGRGTLTGDHIDCPCSCRSKGLHAIDTCSEIAKMQQALALAPGAPQIGNSAPSPLSHVCFEMLSLPLRTIEALRTIMASVQTFHGMCVMLFACRLIGGVCGDTSPKCMSYIHGAATPLLHPWLTMGLPISAP
jgi:hypothetical protein